jgi:hypothetical protein
MKDIYKKTRLAGDVVNLGAARKAKQEAEDAAKKEATKGVLKRVLEMPDK